MGWYGPRGACGCCGGGDPDPCECTGGFTINFSASLINSFATYGLTSLEITNFSSTLSSVDLAIIDDPPTYQPYCDTSVDPAVLPSYYYPGGGGTFTFDWERENGVTGTGSMIIYDNFNPWEGYMFPFVDKADARIGVVGDSDLPATSCLIVPATRTLDLEFPATLFRLPGTPGTTMIRITAEYVTNGNVPPGPP